MRTLAVQNYLQSGRTLDDLTTEYAIRVKVDQALGVAMLNYNQIASPMHEALAQECRALILEIGSWNVASRSFFKFFNYGEPLAAEIDWATASIQEKVDGSLICFYHYQGEWRIATKGMPDASGPVPYESGGRTFRWLVERAIREMGQTLAEFTAQLDTGTFYSFELTAPENRVIIPYAERELTLLGAWDAGSLEELDVEQVARPAGRLARRYPASSLDELLAAAQAIGLGEMEGYVVRDARFRRVKIKSPAYLMIDRVMARLGTPRRRLEFLLAPNYDDVLPTLPEPVRAEILALQKQLRQLIAEVAETYRELRPLAASGTRKEFAVAASQTPYRHLLFRLLDAGAEPETAAEVILAMEPERLARAMNLDIRADDAPGTDN